MHRGNHVPPDLRLRDLRFVRSLVCNAHLLRGMPPTRFEPSTIKNKVKREEIARKTKKAKRQDKLQRRLAQAKEEASDPLLKKVRSRRKHI